MRHFLAKAQKVQTRLSRVLRRPNLRRVRRITLAVSWLCDCRCQMCGIWEIYAKAPALRKTELTSAETVSLLSDASALRHLETVTLTGGEPFIHKEFVNLALALQRRFPSLLLDITTTGQATKLIQEKLRAIADDGGDLGRIHICVSLDGVGEMHDTIRGKRGAFDKAIATVQILRDFRLGSLGLGFTILPSNFRTLKDAYRLSTDLGIGFTMRVAHFNDGIYDNALNAAKHRWTPESLADLESSVRTIMADKAQRRGVLEQLFSSDLYFAEQMLSHVRKPRRLMPCYSGTHSLFLDPFGNVSPCVNLEQKMGSARTQGFDAAWFSPEAAEVRQFIADGRCQCWTECEAFLSFHTSPAYLLYNLKTLLRGRSPGSQQAAERG